MAARLGGRVRITPYRPDDPLLQSDYLFYDLTTIQDFADYRYRFVDTNEQAPVIEGEPHTAIVPYERTIFELKQMVVTAERGRTEVIFLHWSISNTPEPQLFTPTHLETQTLTLPTNAEEK